MVRTVIDNVSRVAEITAYTCGCTFQLITNRRLNLLPIRAEKALPWAGRGLYWRRVSFVCQLWVLYAIETTSSGRVSLFVALSRLTAADRRWLSRGAVLAAAGLVRGNKEAKCYFHQV
jgi:hypothetical protein